MNKADTEYRQLIIQMAQEAGFEELFKDSHDWVCFTEDIERFFQLATEWAAEREREACAKVCEEYAEGLYDNQDVPVSIAADLIRARGETR